MNLKGKIHSIAEVQKISDSFSKQEFVILDDSSQYPQYRKLEVQKDKISLLSGFNVGDMVEASINLNGRLWVNPEGQEVCFNTDVAWKLDKVIKTDSYQPIITDGQDDDLPF